MRPLLLAFLATIIASRAAAQSLFQSVRPDVMVTVTKRSSGSDIVDVAALDPQYPATLLQDQVKALCAELGYTPNGLQVYQQPIASAKGSVVVKARFGTFGIIDDAQKRVRMQAIVRAFAGAPKPFTIHGMAILLSGRKGSAETLKAFGSDSVQLEGQYNPPPAEGLEYRVALLKQDRASISIPERYEPIAKPPTRSAQDPSGGASAAWLLPAILVLTSLSFGGLVYLGLIRQPGKSNSRQP